MMIGFVADDVVDEPIHRQCRAAAAARDDVSTLNLSLLAWMSMDIISSLSLASLAALPTTTVSSIDARRAL
eukprot:scaffold44919_cov34-Prasinocladus_malaysianus.AAC.1